MIIQSGHARITADDLRSVADEMLSGLNAGTRIRARALFNASLMERVPESAEQMLGAVRADGALRHRILTHANRFGRRTPRPARARVSPSWSAASRRLAPALGAALALTLVIGIGLRFYGADMFDPSIAPAQLSENVPMTQSFRSGDLMTGALKLSSGVPDYRSLFVSAEGGEPALVSVNGRYYQMLSAPLALPQDMLEAKIGDMQPLTSDISLADRIGVLSNVVREGEPIYSVRDYSTRTMIAARSGGQMRLFQRVGYAAKSLVGSDERFKDTLSVEGKARALELSGVGIVTDGEKANALISILLSDAREWSGEAVPSGEQALTVYLTNGLALQLNVSGDVVEACGAWSCPRFFEEFRAAVGG
ncbi:MAG: hypothetical protein LBH66_04120 [Oscillospiraceae bacterium]|jgi:hypothetical protein|nr:hypothetical protein [Oscillospiraceae bacterium]